MQEMLGRRSYRVQWRHRRLRCILSRSKGSAGVGSQRGCVFLSE